MGRVCAKWLKRGQFANTYALHYPVDPGDPPTAGDKWLMSILIFMIAVIELLDFCNMWKFSHCPNVARYYIQRIISELQYFILFSGSLGVYNVSFLSVWRECEAICLFFYPGRLFASGVLKFFVLLQRLRQFEAIKVPTRVAKCCFLLRPWCVGLMARRTM